MKYLLILILLFSGCMSGPKIISSKKVDNPSVNQVQSVDFEDIDINKDGAIEAVEYYKQTGAVNSKDPMLGLIFILVSVIVCATISSFVMRPKKISVK